MSSSEFCIMWDQFVFLHVTVWPCTKINQLKALSMFDGAYTLERWEVCIIISINVQIIGLTLNVQICGKCMHVWLKDRTPIANGTVRAKFRSGVPYSVHSLGKKYLVTLSCAQKAYNVAWMYITAAYISPYSATVGRWLYIYRQWV